MPVAEWKEWQEKRFQQALGCSETVEDDGDGDGDGDQRPPGNHNGMTAGVDQRSEPGTTAFWPIDPTLQMTTDPAPTNVTTASTLAIATTSSASDGECHGGHKGKRRRREPLTDFINGTVTSSTGAPVILSKKPRKERSDKGVKRGPRARKSWLLFPFHHLSLYGQSAHMLLFMMFSFSHRIFPLQVMFSCFYSSSSS